MPAGWTKTLSSVAWMPLNTHAASHNRLETTIKSIPKWNVRIRRTRRMGRERAVGRGSSRRHQGLERSGLSPGLRHPLKGVLKGIPRAWIGQRAGLPRTALSPIPPARYAASRLVIGQVRIFRRERDAKSFLANAVESCDALSSPLLRGKLRWIGFQRPASVATTHTA